MYIYNKKRIINLERFDYLYVDENAVFARKDEKDVTIRKCDTHEEAERLLESIYELMKMRGENVIDVYGICTAPRISD